LAIPEADPVRIPFNQVRATRDQGRVVTSHGDAAVRAAPDSGSPALREPDSVVAITGPHRYREGVPGKLIVAGAAALLGIEAAVVAERRGTVFHADTVVRCQAGHLFTTWWIPGVSVKAVRLGWWRLQRCPIGPHWSLVTPVVVSTLTETERELAAAHHDVRLP